ncbi:MAG: hypothetical protein LBQ22_13125 [Bacteroidales bacterium]|jgi:hypothetical protein|nr:hypothetical protein [Bacteroidales bacterium]
MKFGPEHNAKGVAILNAIEKLSENDNDMSIFEEIPITEDDYNRLSDMEKEAKNYIVIN